MAPDILIKTNCICIAWLLITEYKVAILLCFQVRMFYLLHSTTNKGYMRNASAINPVTTEIVDSFCYNCDSNSPFTLAI